MPPGKFALCATLLLSLSIPTFGMAGQPLFSQAQNGDWILADRFEQRPPNFLLVIMDDVGIDQMESFGYGGATPPAMPSIDAIADGGIRFRNTWAMPVCSPTRSALLTGRYPMRNRLEQVIGPNDLANSQLSQFEVTAPKLLRHAGYRSAMFGKFHLAGPFNHAAGNGTPQALGWDYFAGFILGAPSSIDTTAGGIGPAGTYSCGFIPDAASDPVHGADSGACYLPDGTGGIGCLELAGNNTDGDPPGLQCLTDGGILVPNQSCQAEAPGHLAWEHENAHYVSPLMINHDGQVEEVPLTDPRGRGYRSTIEIDAAIDWIQQHQASSQPWMATVSFTAPHTPLQQPPAHLLPSGLATHLDGDCDDPIRQRLLSDAMTEALDAELGRLMLATGLAESGPGGELHYDPADSDTVIVVLGDNGTFAPLVKAPFDAQRAKGTPYQTGIWVPLMVAGPEVDQPGRFVEHMVNVTDVFRLFGELAGLDVPALVPGILDAAPMRAYLDHADQAPLREFNFVQTGQNLQLHGGVNGPCEILDLCSHTLPAKAVCEVNGGIWWGEGADDPSIVPDLIESGVEHCWQVNQAIYHHDPAQYESNRVPMMPTATQAIGNDHFKLIRSSATDYDPATDSGVATETEEFYHINRATPVPLLDTADRDLLAAGDLDPVPALHYKRLSQQLDDIMASQVDCPGDGNYDGRVDQTDIDNYHSIVDSGWSGSSTYDFNLDGQTDEADLQIIMDHLGTVCRPDAIQQESERGNP